MSPRTYSERDIHLALDGELSAEEQAGYQDWLDANPDMKALALRFNEDRDKLRQALAAIVDEPVPARLSGLVTDGERAGKGRPAPWWRVAAAAALLALGGAAGYVSAQVFHEQSQTGKIAPMAENAIRAHLIYANEKRHVVEVGADQTEHLNTWLSNRVGMKLVAPDLKPQGYDLVGGRLLPYGDKTAAQFMYQDPTGNRISLYVTRDEKKRDTGYRLAEERGARTLYWLDGGYGCALTGMLPEKTLTELANAAYDQLVQSAGAH